MPDDALVHLYLIFRYIRHNQDLALFDRGLKLLQARAGESPPCQPTQQATDTGTP